MFALLLCFLGLISAVSAQCDNGYTYFSGNCYIIKYNSFTFALADAACVEDGGHLTSIHDNATDEFVKNYAMNSGVRTVAWIGIRNNGGSKTWTDSSAVDFKNFAPGQDQPPVCYGISVVSFYYAGQWIPQSCSANLPFICQRKPTFYTTPQTTTGCGPAKFYGNNGSIYSPGYPNVFHNADCNYTINAWNANANIEIPMIKALDYYNLNVYSDVVISPSTLLYSANLFKPMNGTARISSPTPTIYIVFTAINNNDINPFIIQYSGSDGPLYPIYNGTNTTPSWNSTWAPANYTQNPYNNGTWAPSNYTSYPINNSTWYPIGNYTAMTWAPSNYTSYPINNSTWYPIGNYTAWAPSSNVTYYPISNMTQYPFYNSTVFPHVNATMLRAGRK